MKGSMCSNDMVQMRNQCSFGAGGHKIECRLIAGSNHRQQLRRKLLGTKKSPKIEPLTLLALKDWIGDVPYLLSVVNEMPGDASTKINNPL